MSNAQKGELATAQGGHEIQAAPSGADSLMKIIDRAASSADFDVAKLQQLLEVKERWEANEARKAFFQAMADFKANPPKIRKNKHVAFQTGKGKTEYDHATLDHVAEEVSKAMAPHGLRFSWDTKQLDGGAIQVSCVVTHVQGHSESVTLTGGRDDSGSKNSLQSVGSAITYLQRYTLMAATGLAAAGQDDDASNAEPVPRISEEKQSKLVDMVDATGSDLGKFLRWLGVNDLMDVTEQMYERGMKALERKQKEQEKANDPA